MYKSRMHLLFDVDLLDFHKLAIEFWNINDQDAVLQLCSDALDINMSWYSSGAQTNLAFESTNLALIKGQRLQECLVTWAMYDTRDGQLALLGIPSDANILLVCTWQRNVH